jgi:hypothetical protein
VNEAEERAYRAGMAAVTRDVQKALTQEYERHAGSLGGRDLPVRLAIISVAIYLKVRGIAVDVPNEEALWLKAKLKDEQAQPKAPEPPWRGRRMESIDPPLRGR